MKDACTYQHCLGSNTEGVETVLHYLLYVGTTQDSRLRGRAGEHSDWGRTDAGGRARTDGRKRRR